MTSARSNCGFFFFWIVRGMFVPRRVQGTLAAVHSLHHLTDRGLSLMPDSSGQSVTGSPVWQGRGRGSHGPSLGRGGRLKDN